ncbi:MAG: type II secretion system protein [Patescibacteria group bacterium]
MKFKKGLVLRCFRGFTRQNFLKKISDGFTLIELLVVFAIIAILVSIVLVSLSDAKLKGNDAGVKSNLNTIRSVTEIFYSDNRNSYLPSGGSAFNIATCPAYDASGTNMFSKDKTISNAIAEAVKRGNGSSCYNSKDVWAVAVGLKSNANASWCVDSGGSSKREAFTPATAIDASTFSCR